MARGLPWIAFLFLACLWIYAIGWAVAGYPIYRDQHLGAALLYAKDGIDLLRPVIPGFNATGTSTPQEFPAWQGLAGLALRMAGGWWGAANVVSLLLFSLSLPFFWRVARAELDVRAAWLALVLLLAQPLVFHLAGGAQTDGFSLALLLFFIWSTEHLRKNISWGNFLLCVSGASALAVTKLPFLFVGGLAASLRLLWSRPITPSGWLALGCVGLGALLVFLPWNLWCEREIGRAIFQYRPLTFRENPEWFLGSWQYRLDPANWLKAGWRALACLWGSFVLVGLTFYSLWKNPRSLGACLLYGAMFTTLIFTKLVLVHRHYYLMYAPGVALLNARALAEILPGANRWTNLGLAVLLGLSLAQGLVGLEAPANGDPFIRKVAGILSSYTRPQEKLLVVGGGWGGDVFLHANRQGLTVDDSRWAENPDTLRQLKLWGYTKMVWISESPLLHALQVTNPGGAERKRERFPATPSPAAISWPVVYQSEDLVIQELPALRP